ncbi:hypothetical protein [Spiroplasma endosymbiont of 'Nebria riversi']|uniref:hypothetical protein n=1 Tax=Spiroplasma endosymbiont of 'Nebria riversi' TaxID=2792084 RepID=UPI001C03EC2C|nr:hypothetical protein [Spiroplasma endosymbiont of 'Nebria riversi']
MYKKFLIALSLANIMLVSACNSTNSKIEEKYNLEFAEILNSSFVNTSVSNYLTGWLQINSVKNQLPSDTGYSDFYIVYNDGNGNIISSVFDFYKKNGVLKNKTYSIDKIVNVKITIASIPGYNSGNFWITSFSMEMPH